MQKVVLVLIGSLALVALWRDQHLQHLWQMALNSNPSGASFQAELAPVGIDLLGVAVITFVAGINAEAAKIMLAVSIGLWLVFLMSSRQAPARAGASIGAKI